MKIKHVWVIMGFCLFISVSRGWQLSSSTPPMGWNSWFTYGPTVTESNIKTQADALVSSGLLAKGYTLVSVDVGWPKRVSGNLVGNPSTFPSGMASLGTYIHGKSEYYGIYSSPGPTECDPSVPPAPGSYTFETADATSFASWNVDYLKYDWCSGGDVYANTPAGVQTAYQTMGTVISGTGRAMYYLVSESQSSYGYGNAWTFFQTVGGNEYWVVEIVHSTSVDNAEFGQAWTTLSAYQNKGHWLNDDMLICGQYSVPITTGNQTVTDGDCQTQFNFFALIAAPLIVSADITSFDPTVLATLGNSEVIAVNQDSGGVMGHQVTNAVCGSSHCPVWARALANGTIAVGFFNRDSSTHSITLNFNSLATGHTYYAVRDLISHTNLGTMGSYTAVNVPAPGSIAPSSTLLLLTPTPTGTETVEVAAKGIVIQ